MMKKYLPHLIGILSLLLLSVIYFYPQIQGQKLSQSDLVNYRGMASEMSEWQAKTGHKPLWTNSMFAGMPTYQISSSNEGNISRLFEKGFQFFISRPIGYFLACSISMYILLICLGCSPWIAVIGAIGYTYTSSILTLYEAGHTSKMRVLSFLPLITAGVVVAYREKYFLGTALFAIGAGVGLLANHPQMLYYMTFPLLFYVLMKGVKSVKEKEILSFVKASSGLLIALVVALGCSATVLLTTMEYTGDTMRGSPILEESKSGESTSSTESGLDWEYAMQWSQNMKDVMTIIVPGAAGGGSMEPASWSKDLKRDQLWSQVLRGNNDMAPLYHGGLPFTSGPAYLGILFILFFVLGYYVKGGNFYHWILISTLFTILLSMGKNMEFVNRIMFDYVPMYDKFRTPNSIMPITSLLMVIGGAIGLKDFFISLKQKTFKDSYLYLSGAITAGLCLLAWVVVSSQGFQVPQDVNMTQQGLNLDPLLSARQALLKGDVMRNIGLIVLAVGTLYFFLKGKLQRNISLGILAVIVLFDVWSVGKRYLNADSFHPERIVSSENPRQVDQEIMKDKDPHFRVYDMSINTFNSATSSHFYKTIGGYHAAKLQRYQDLIDYHISRGNQAVLDMLNTKYVIDQTQELHRNPNAYGNAWFVADVKTVNSNMEEIESLNNTDLRNTAVIHTEFSENLSEKTYNKNGASVKLTEYTPEKMTYTSQNPGDGLMVFSEIWYGPDKGWKAYVDGNEVPLFRVDYALRGIEVPQGNHEIVMEFHPTTYYSGLTISYISSALMLILVVGGLFLYYRKENPIA